MPEDILGPSSNRLLQWNHRYRAIITTGTQEVFRAQILNILYVHGFTPSVLFCKIYGSGKKNAMIQNKTTTCCCCKK